MRRSIEKNASCCWGAYYKLLNTVPHITAGARLYNSVGRLKIPETAAKTGENDVIDGYPLCLGLQKSFSLRTVDPPDTDLPSVT